MARLWWVRPETIHETPAVLALLSPEERTKHQRFIPPEKRHEYLVTRLLVRTLLGRELGLAPEEVEFTFNPWGRPELSPESGLRFNVSHTRGLVLCLTSREHEVGVDTELLSRAPSILKLAPKVFAPAERSDLDALPAEAQLHRAVQLWTLKESYIKARGWGLALSLQGFAFRFDGDAIRLDVEPALEDDGARWQFQTLSFGEHLISTALAQSAQAPVAIEVCEARLG